MKDGHNKRLILVTGPPRTGKTTVLLKVASKLRIQGYRIGGMISEERREENSRVGFEIVDLASGRKGWLANIRQAAGPRLGKYRVNLEDLDSIGTAAILRALNDADVVLVDEIGPMELCSESFIEAVRRAAESTKPILATIHYRAQHQLIKHIKSRQDARVVEITLENRATLPDIVVNDFMNLGHR
jgi:nucleoside-triphosphatase